MKNVILFLICIAASNINAQTSLIETGIKSVDDYPEYAPIFDTYASSSEFVNMEIATICDLESCAPAVDETYYIDVNDQQAYWMPSIVEKQGNSSYFGGMLDDDIGSLALTFADNGISGRLNINNEAYNIVPLEGNDVLFVKYTKEPIPSSCSALAGSSSSNSFGLCNSNNLDLCQAVVTVLCVANQETFNWLESNNLEWEKHVFSAQGRMNEILINSGIQNKRFQLIAHPIASEIDDGIELNVSVHFSQPMQDLLNITYSADILFHYCVAVPGTADGQAYCNGAIDGTPVALSEIKIDRSLEINMPHEIGHLFNISHQDGEDKCGGSGCHEAWDIFTQIGASVKRVTSVWTGSGTPGEYSRRYSNPFVRFQGLPAGIINEHFSARQLANRFCEVAENNPTLDFMVDIISTPTIGEDPECPESYTLQASLNVPGPGLPGQPGYSYEWRSSTIPIFSTTNPGTFESNSASFVFDHPGGIRPNRYMQLTVTGSDGFSLTMVKHLTFCHIPKDPDLPDGRLIKYSKNLTIVPNPVADNQSVTISYTEATHNITLMSNTGQVVFSQDILSGTARVDIPTAILPAKGLYIVVAKDSSGTVLNSEFLIHQ